MRRYRLSLPIEGLLVLPLGLRGDVLLFGRGRGRRFRQREAFPGLVVTPPPLPFKIFPPTTMRRYRLSLPIEGLVILPLGLRGDVLLVGRGRGRRFRQREFFSGARCHFPPSLLNIDNTYNVLRGNVDRDVMAFLVGGLKGRHEREETSNKS